MPRWIRLVSLVIMAVLANRAGASGVALAAEEEPPPKTTVAAGVAKSACFEHRGLLDVGVPRVRPAVFAIGGRLGRSVGEQLLSQWGRAMTRASTSGRAS